MKKYVLDACALRFYLEGTPPGRKVQKLLESAADGNVLLVLSAVNWAEILYPTFRNQGPKRAKDLLVFLETLPLVLQPADADVSLEAARLKGIYGFGLADAYAAATATTLNAALVTSDAAFKVIENQLEIYWL